MEQVLTLKVRLYPTSEQAKLFKAVLVEYQRLCNIVSQWYFDENFLPSRPQFQKEMYYRLRANSKLNSQMVQSVFRTILARYEAVSTQLKRHPFRYDTGKKDKHGKAIWKSIHKDLTWLQKPIKFKRPQADYVRNRSYSLVNAASLISINTLSKRLKVKYDLRVRDFLLTHTLKDAKLVQACGKWFLHIAYLLKSKDWQQSTNCKIVGIDRGLRQIMTCYGNHGKTTFFNGKRVAYLRKKYHYLRKQLQKVNTKSAKRKLKKLGHKENRWMNVCNKGCYQPAKCSHI